MALENGTRLGDYEIAAAIGAGGMGEVYRARDTKLGRDVAIKILPEAFSRDKDRLARFEREARLLASLNHPGIATLHAFETGSLQPERSAERSGVAEREAVGVGPRGTEKDDVRFLVMELVEGETLEEQIERGPLTIEDTVSLFANMAEAMDAAHEKGIIHRDLKPANIKITPDGRPKILDFGLAKGDGAAADANISESPTVTRRTSAGIILGTAPYMSPEQARGQPLDKRTDIWSFGCVLYEALTAGKAFDGDTVADILGAIVKTEPDWRALPSTTPTRIRKLLERCLAKDMRRRLRDMGEAWIVLDDDGDEAIPAPSRSSLPLLATVSLVAAGLVWLAFARVEDSPPRRVVRTEISLPTETVFHPARAASVAVSPDSRHLAFVARRGETTGLYLRALDQMEAMLVDKGQGGRMPFFSPDGEWLGFLSGGELMKVSVSGGAAVPLAKLAGPGRGASWGDDGNIVFSFRGLWRVSANGGEVEVVKSLDRERREKHSFLPEVLPGGKAVVFMLANADTPSFDDAHIAVLSLETGESKIVLEGGTHPRYSPSGHLVYARAGSLLAVAFDLDELRTTGTPVPVLDGVTMTPVYANAAFALSRDGTLLYAPGDVWGNTHRVVRVDRQGQSEPLIEAPGFYLGPQLSPDGRSLAVTTGTANATIAVYDLERQTMTPVALGWDNTYARWTPDGRNLTFYSNRSGVHNLYQQAADGSSEAKHLGPGDVEGGFTWSPDGTVLAFGVSGDIWLLSTSEERKKELFLQTEFEESWPRLSPDGRWIAYVSNHSGQDEIYVRPFPRSEGMKHVGRGSDLEWNPNGRELFYVDGDKMMVVDVATAGETISVGSPRLLFERLMVRSDFDVSPDGQHFVMIEWGDFVMPTRLNLVVNFAEELKRLVPP